MQPYNILVGCDQLYFDNWATPLLKSIQRHNSWFTLHCHIVNPTKENILDGVDITSEQRKFINDESKISYLQSVRFLVVADKFKNNENVFTLDADTICTRKIGNVFTQRLFEKQHILKHHKENRWLAGFVTFNNSNFRKDLARELDVEPVDKWRWGRDQTILNSLAEDYNYQPLDRLWMAIGKNRHNSAFLTLKGEQKYTDKYLNVYRKYLDV